MCTVSFIARPRGYALAMNRDEQLTRPRGLPPKLLSTGGRKVICPSERGGGTWIALNNAGVTFALINWYAIGARVKQNAVSRGEVVRAVRSLSTAEGAAAALGALPLERINPFRLIGVFPARRELHDWQWDLQQLVGKRHRWRARQWISSGHDEPGAQRVRGRTFRLALQQKSAGSLAWLRRLHRSHAPVAGPYSTCMHRADAATVSCSEIMVSGRRAGMRHYPGAPCGVCPAPVIYFTGLSD